jgi:hypothetical protein
MWVIPVGLVMAVSDNAYTNNETCDRQPGDECKMLFETGYPVPIVQQVKTSARELFRSSP